MGLKKTGEGEEGQSRWETRIERICTVMTPLGLEGSTTILRVPERTPFWPTWMMGEEEEEEEDGAETVRFVEGDRMRSPEVWRVRGS